MYLRQNQVLQSLEEFSVHPYLYPKCTTILVSMSFNGSALMLVIFRKRGGNEKKKKISALQLQKLSEI